MGIKFNDGFYYKSQKIISNTIKGLAKKVDTLHEPSIGNYPSSLNPEINFF
jgi:hypothetical protein